MTTIKAHTDISQSETLSKILPLESADMHYEDCENGFKIHCESSPFGYEYNIPCWSLASLLGMLPKRIEIVDNVYELSVYLYGLYYWNISNGNLCFESKDKDNLVDACYEMILKLNELKML